MNAEISEMQLYKDNKNPLYYNYFFLKNDKVNIDSVISRRNEYYHS